MRVKMTIGPNTFEFSGFSTTTMWCLLSKWFAATGVTDVVALADKLERQNQGLEDAVAANTPPATK